MELGTERENKNSLKEPQVKKETRAFQIFWKLPVLLPIRKRNATSEGSVAMLCTL